MILFLIILVIVILGLSYSNHLKTHDLSELSTVLQQQKKKNENEFSVLRTLVEKKLDGTIAAVKNEFEEGKRKNEHVAAELEKARNELKPWVVDRVRAELRIEANRIREDADQYAAAVRNEADQRVFLLRKRLDRVEQQIHQLTTDSNDVTIRWIASQFSGFLEDSEKEAKELFALRKRQATRAEEIVAEFAKKRRESEMEARRYRLKCEYYEKVFPLLNDLIDDEKDSLVEESFWDGTEQVESMPDESVRWLTKEEYEQLDSVSKGQLALDRYNRRHKTRWEIGLEYEDFVGYEYEKQGFSVEYKGYSSGLEDLGRDLICKKGNLVHIVQCKRWTTESIIHEKHINQLIGTALEYAIHNNAGMPNLGVNASSRTIVVPVFVTTTCLSETAKRFASVFGVKVSENHEFNSSYPKIKCNISGRNQEKIYHLPFDQQYRTTKIDRPGECWVCTVREAEEKGFRRALRHFA